MIKPLSTAKLVSVREIKKKAKAKKTNKVITTVVIVVLLLLVLLVSLDRFVLTDDTNLLNIFSSKNKYTETELGVTFISYDFSVIDAIKALENDQNITILFEVPAADDQYLLTISDLFYIYPSVFSAKQKKITLVIGLTDSEGNLISCHTNLGDVYVNEELSFDECQSLIQKDNTLIHIRYPTENIKESTVLLNVEEKMIAIFGKNTEDQHVATFLLLRAMYEEFDEIMEKVNEFKIDQNISLPN